MIIVNLRLLLEFVLGETRQPIRVILRIFIKLKVSVSEHVQAIVFLKYILDRLLLSVISCVIYPSLDELAIGFFQVNDFCLLSLAPLSLLFLPLFLFHVVGKGL